MQVTFKNLIRVMCVGGLIGAALSLWIAPHWIVWYFRPPVDFGVDCSKPIDWALTRLRRAQLFGIGTGAALSLTLYLLFSRRSRISQQ